MIIVLGVYIEKAMTTRLVRDVMTIGVPVCRDVETGAAVLARLTGDVVVVLVEFLFLMHDWPGEPRPSAVEQFVDGG